MVCMAVSSLGISSIHVLKPGAVITGAYCRNVVLRWMLLPDISAASGSDLFVFQQYSAPSHHAKDTVAPSAAGARDARFCLTHTQAT